jgi:predicted flap endonuclease-1-like 5' DNA nuclease
MLTREQTAEDARLKALAVHNAHRNRLRALRAERLARLRHGGAEIPAPGEAIAAALAAAAEPDAAAPRGPRERPRNPPPGEASAPGPARECDAAALEDLLRALTETGVAGTPPAAPAEPAPAEVLPFQRAGTPPAASDLAALPGVGPGLVWALGRAGVASLADLAAAAPEELAARLGPVGRLVDIAGWIAAAQQSRESTARGR